MTSMDQPLVPMGTIHHVELWVPDLDRATATWGWLLTELGYQPFQDWPGGRSWRAGQTYIVVEQSPARTASRHDRCRPGLNHLAFHMSSREHVDKLTGEALARGWRLMFADVHPYAGGSQHYAAYLENSDGFEVELVAPALVAQTAVDSPAGSAAAGWLQSSAPGQAPGAQAPVAQPAFAQPAFAQSAPAELTVPAQPGPAESAPTSEPGGIGGPGSESSTGWPASRSDPDLGG
jgi:catechol 2,3-dioxygenase-like lactoylglutathione lyase family enzyme